MLIKKKQDIKIYIFYLYYFRLTKVKKAASPGKLKTCNIPCYIYRKFGRCKAQESGKCFRKHDPDQIALCTK